MSFLLSVAIVAGILLDLIAFGANAGILWVVLGNKNLRKTPTSVFLLNLCISDIFVALFLIPIAITILFSAFGDDGLYVPTYLCEPVSFVSSLLVFSGVWAAAALSVERRFSIVSPMAHAAFMTTRRALIATAMVWIIATVFALLPHIFPNENHKQLLNYTTSTAMVLVSSMHSNSTYRTSNFYYFSYNSSTSVITECRTWKKCATMFTLDWTSSSHVFAVVIGCYVIPALLMIFMYVSIFKVARKASLQKSSTMSISTISGEAKILRESEAVENNGIEGNYNFRNSFWNDKTADLSYSMEEDFSCPQCSRSGRLDISVSDVSAAKSISAGGKARRTLLLIMGLSLVSWTPYYVVHAYCACTDDCWKELWELKLQCFANPGSIPCNAVCSTDMFPVSFFLYRRSHIVSIVVWLLFLSSAFNPILYGLLNRPVREQVIIRANSTTAFCSHVVRCQRCGETSGGGERIKSEEEAGGVEDFMQFLERTSSLSDSPTARSSILRIDRA